MVDQVSRQYEAAADAGTLTRDAADAGIAESYRSANRSAPPANSRTSRFHRSIAPLFPAASLPFLARSRYPRPGGLAAALPVDLPV